MRVGDNRGGPAGFVLAAMSQSAVSSTRTASLPVDGMGAPDFEKIKAAGGKVDGILPGGNASMAVYGAASPTRSTPRRSRLPTARHRSS